MTERDFVYWLQGFVEINGAAPTQHQWEIIKDHLQLVFDKQTPDRTVAPSADWTYRGWETIPQVAC